MRVYITDDLLFKYIRNVKISVSLILIPKATNPYSIPLHASGLTNKNKFIPVVLCWCLKTDNKFWNMMNNVRSIYLFQTIYNYSCEFCLIMPSLNAEEEKYNTSNYARAICKTVGRVLAPLLAKQVSILDNHMVPWRTIKSSFWLQSQE